MLTTKELEQFQPWLESVAKMGSKVLPWIKEPHDTDYDFFVADKRVAPKLVELFKLKPDNECWFVTELATCKYARLYAYEYHFLQPVFGTKFPDYDIFEHEIEYKKVLIEHGFGKPATNHKFWYHVLTGIYMLDNGTYDLTEEQIEKINLCHNKQMTEEIYEYIQERLTKYKVELGA